MKPIEAGCLALIISGKDIGKTVRCVSSHYHGEVITLPNGVTTRLIDEAKKGTPWLCIGSVHAKGSDGKKFKDGAGFAFFPEPRLLRIDSEGDDELIEEFAMEEAGFIMEEMMISEGVKRLW